MKNLLSQMTSDINVKTAKDSDLLDWYNLNSGSAQLKSFRDRETAEQKVQELKDAILSLSGKEGSKKVTAKKAKKEVKAKAQKESKTKAAKKDGSKKESSGEGKAGRSSSNAGKKLYRLVKENPRREGTNGFKSWQVITKDGMTYEDYVAAGGRPKDLAWDVAKGNIQLK